MFLAACRGLQGPPGPPGASRGLQGPPKTPKTLTNEKIKPWARLKFHGGWSGWTRPPTMAGGGGGGQAEVCLQGGERPEAGCLGELLGTWTLKPLNPKP